MGYLGRWLKHLLFGEIRITLEHSRISISFIDYYVKQWGMQLLCHWILPLLAPPYIYFSSGLQYTVSLCGQGRQVHLLRTGRQTVCVMTHTKAAMTNRSIFELGLCVLRNLGTCERTGQCAWSLGSGFDQ